MLLSAVRRAATAGGRRALSTGVPACQASSNYKPLEEHDPELYSLMQQVLTVAPPISSLPLRDPRGFLVVHCTCVGWHYLYLTVMPAFTDSKRTISAPNPLRRIVPITTSEFHCSHNHLKCQLSRRACCCLGVVALWLIMANL